MKQIIIFLNIADKSDLACGLINFFRYFLRFQSAYIIVAFTLQRVIIVFSPLANRFKSKQSAWKTFHFITFISVIINLWVPFYFKVCVLFIDYLFLFNNYTYIHYIFDDNRYNKTKENSIVMLEKNGKIFTS